MKEEFKETTLNRQDIFYGKIVGLHVDDVMLPDGKTSKREVVDHTSGVGVVVYDREDRSIYLVEQYRYAVGKQLYEIPAGKVEEGEIVIDCALRELKEEIGASAEEKDLTLLSSFYVSPGFTSEKIYVYFCETYIKGDNHPDEGEFLNVRKISVSEAMDLIDRGEISDAKTIIGIVMAEKEGLFR